MDSPFQFPQGSITPRKREILAWLKAHRCQMDSLDPGDPQSLEAFRMYIPLHLSREPESRACGGEPSVFDLVRELFDYKFALAYVDSYPWNVDKYCLAQEERRWQLC
jgi:hypothetical protein